MIVLSTITTAHECFDKLGVMPGFGEGTHGGGIVLLLQFQLEIKQKKLFIVSSALY